jgi:predicted lipase
VVRARSATAILSAVKNTLKANPYFSVIIVGHSLGGTIALLDGLFLVLQSIVSLENVRVISYGMPRVGNQAFADLVDDLLSGVVTHVNNREDPIPTMPDRLLGYHHSSGEVHIQDSGEWNVCPGAFHLCLSLNFISLPALKCGVVRSMRL